MGCKAWQPMGVFFVPALSWMLNFQQDDLWLKEASVNSPSFDSPFDALVFVLEKMGLADKKDRVG